MSQETSQKTYDEIVYEVDGPVAVITFNRPDTLNAFTGHMQEEIRHAIAQAESNEDVVGIVITGAGRGFCSGMDMNALGDMTETGERGGGQGDPALKTEIGADLGDNFHLGFTFLMTVRKPIIAAVNGPCAGLGMSFALMCDLRFAAQSTKFITSFSQRGLVAEHGQCWILPRIVGPSRALDLFFTSRRLGPEEALQMGLVNRVCEDDGLVDDAKAYVRELAEMASPTSLMYMKQQVYRHLNMTLKESMEETEVLMDASLKREDFKEGVASFVERRPPKYKRVTNN